VFWKGWKFWAALGFPIVVALMAILVLSRGPESRQVSSSELPEGQPPDAWLKSLQYTEVKDGVKQWHLEAQEAEYTRESGMGRLKGVEVTFFLADGGEMAVTSQAGSFSSPREEIRLVGDVKGRTLGSGPLYRIEAPELRYSGKSRRLYTDGPGTVFGPGFRTHGNGLSYQIDSHDFRIHRDARTFWEERLF